MGARYVPSVANIVLNKWEQETIFNNGNQALTFYKRYIDDGILLWEGSQGDLQSFLQQIIINNYGLKFTAEWSISSINYLDLTLTRYQDKIGIRTFFKETDRNGFVPTQSCHHPQWLGVIPKRQYMRIRRNCDNLDDFHNQAQIQTDKFQEKVCAIETLHKAKNQVLAITFDYKKEKAIP